MILELGGLADLAILAGGALAVFGAFAYCVQQDIEVRNTAKKVTKIEEEIPLLMTEQDHHEMCVTQERRFGVLVEQAISGLKADVESLRRTVELSLKEGQSRMDKMDILREEREKQDRQMVAALGRIEGVIQGMQDKVSLR